MNTTLPSFWQILSHLAMLHRRGVLVPFIGSGMSVPACLGWKPFLIKLAIGLEIPLPLGLERSKELQKFHDELRNAKIPIPAEIYNGENANQSGLLIRLADTVMEVLRSAELPKQRQLLVDALTIQSGQIEIPLQTTALAEIAWPLVLTTNYEDLYWCAASAPRPVNPFSNRHPTWTPEIVGRSRQDCHRVLQSLGSLSPRLLWALQGFLGGPVTQNAAATFGGDDRLNELTRQVVLGHQQYQNAINGEPHFRRAFAEVLRRRSLLFVGSGLLEDYVVNLLSEIVHHHGTGPYPHYALLNGNQRELFDSGFLQRRLGIVPVFYDSYTDIPVFLSALAAMVKGDRNKLPKEAKETVAVRPRMLAFEVIRPSPSPDLERFTVKMHDYGIPVPADDRRECISVSLGRGRGDAVIPGPQASNRLQAIRKAYPDFKDAKWAPAGDSRYAFRYGDSMLFGIVARSQNADGQDIDRRDLAIIPDAVFETLCQMDAAGFETAYLGEVAAGAGAPWHQIHPFSQMLRGIQRFTQVKDVRNLSRIEVCLMGWQVWDEVVAGKIPVGQLLTTELVSQRVDFKSHDGTTESLFLTFAQAPTLRGLMEECKARLDDWIPMIVPPPTDDNVNKEPELDTPIAATMTVVLSARSNSK